MAKCLFEPIRVSTPPLVEPESLLIEISEQVEWLNAHVGAADRAFQK
jgi:hypothetical protein